jgi:aspartyl-tRNA synthetase
MIAGCDRYFQFARCLRDEDLRADRQPEHTQIDLEMSFVTEDEVFATVEGLMVALWRDVLGVEIKSPFMRLTFRESMSRFGTDKPDLRFGLEFTDVTAICAQSPRNVIANGAKAPGGVAAAMVVPGGAEISGTQLRKFEDVVKEAGGGGLTFFKVIDADREKQQVIFPGALLDQFLATVKASKGDAVLFTNCPWEKTLKALGVLRTQLGQPMLKSKEHEWRFLWVREFPIFEPAPAHGAGRRGITCSRCRRPSTWRCSRPTRATCTPRSTTWC